jgi:hypothetical protein
MIAMTIKATLKTSIKTVKIFPMRFMRDLSSNTQKVFSGENTAMPLRCGMAGRRSQVLGLICRDDFSSGNGFPTPEKRNSLDNLSLPANSTLAGFVFLV